MFDINCRGTQTGLSLALLSAFLGLILLLPTTAVADGSTISVGPPSGTDDTTVLQAALDNCMTNHPTGCTMQLSAGTYKSQQLIAENFHGTVQGMGMDITTVEVLSPLVVTVSNDNVFNLPPSRTNKYPMLLIFTGGDITVSDMTFKVTDADPATSWCYGSRCDQTWLKGLMGVIGSSANLSVQRVGFEGGTGTLDGQNYDNGPFFLGGPLLRGTFRVVSSRFRYAENSFEVFGVTDSQIIIGGSPQNGNVFESTLLGGVICDMDHSALTYAYNNVALGASSFYAGLFAIQGCRSVPQQTSQFLVQHNQIHTPGNYADGILIADYGPYFGLGKKADVVISDNTMQLSGSDAGPTYAGIESLFTVGAVISNNRISGENALIGISAEADSHCTMLGNNLQQLQPLFVHLALLGVKSGFPFNTNNCTVVGGNNEINAYDEGTNDILVGVNNMQGNPPGPAITAAMQNRLNVLKSLKRP